MVDDLAATFLGACAIDQIGVANRFTVRLGARQYWWHRLPRRRPKPPCSPRCVIF
jgi:hypothetical protein